MRFCPNWRKPSLDSRKRARAARSLKDRTVVRYVLRDAYVGPPPPKKLCWARKRARGAAERRLIFRHRVRQSGQKRGRETEIGGLVIPL